MTTHISPEHSPASVPRIFGDVPPFMALPYVPDLEHANADAVVIGMPFDGIATYRGGATRRASQEIRKYSLLFGGYHFDWDFDALASLRVIDSGDIDIVPGNARASYERLEAKIAAILGLGAVPLMIGGDHGVTFPAVRAVASAANLPVGVIVFDTHLDLAESFRNDHLTRASPLKRICELPNVDPRRVVVIGPKGARNLAEWTPLYKELGITVFSDLQVQQHGIAALARVALEIAAPDGQPPYVSVDIDSVDPAFAPATNSPEPGGLTSREIIIGVRTVAERGLLGFDVVEVAPEWDSPSGTTSILAAKLFVEAICSLAALRAQRTASWRASTDCVQVTKVGTDD